MLASLNSSEIYRLALLIGAFVAIKYKDKYGVIPGGIIIPGLLIILFLLSPGWCLTLLSLIFPTYWIYKRYFNRTDYKRRTPMYILSALSLAIASLVALLYAHWGWLTLSLDSLTGMLIPAIIGFTCTKQNMSKVLRGTVVATGITAILVLAIYSLGTYIFQLDFNTIQSAYQGKEQFQIQYPLLQFYLALLAGYLVYRYQNVRSGGYMVTPIAAVLLIHPLSAIAFLGGCWITYCLTRLICHLTLTIGLKRYVLALFISTIFVWSIEIILIQIDSTLMPFQGSDTFAIIAMMSYANDGILYANKNIFSSMVLTLTIAIFVLLCGNLLAQILI